MEAEGTLADENQESYQCPFSVHHMFDKMPSSNSPNKIAAAAEISDGTDFSGVRKRKWDPITKKRVLLGTFNSADEASGAYLAKQREFVSAQHMFDEMPSSNLTDKTAATEISDSIVVDLQHAANFSGVRKRKRGEYIAEKWDPITKERVWSGTFNSVEEASEAYLAKQREFVSAQHMFDEMPSSNSTKKTAAAGERDKADQGKTLFIKEVSFRDKNGLLGAEWHNMGRLTKKDPFKKRKVRKSSNSNIDESKKPVNVVNQGKEPVICVESDRCNTVKRTSKPKTGILGIRKQKNGRYGAEIRDPIKHKQVWLGTFDTIEEASQAYLSKKSEFDMLSQGNKENKTKNCDQIRPESSVGASLFMDDDQTLNAANVGRNKENKAKNRGQTQPESSVAASLFVADDQTLHAANVGRNKENKAKNRDQTQPESSVGASLFVANDQTLHAANVGRNKENKAKNCDQTQPESSVGASLFVANDQTLYAPNVGRNKENKSKNCDQIQPESSVGASSFVANDQTLHAASVGRNGKNDSHKTMRIVGVHKNKWGKYTSEIINPISKKKIWLGTFGTYEEASQVYQSKKLEFKKLVKPKKKCNKKTHSNAREKQVGKEKLVNAKQGHVNYEGLQPESAVKFDVQSSKKAELQSLKFDVQSSKKAELQSQMSVDFSTGEKQAGQEDADLWMGQWVQLPSGKEVNFSLKLGLPIIDNYGSLLGEFSGLDDLRIYDESIY